MNRIGTRLKIRVVLQEELLRFCCQVPLLHVQMDKGSWAHDIRETKQNKTKQNKTKQNTNTTPIELSLFYLRVGLHHLGLTSPSGPVLLCHENPSLENQSFFLPTSVGSRALGSLFIKAFPFYLVCVS